MGKDPRRRVSVLLAHRDATWVDQAKQRLVDKGYDVTDCLEPDWAADLLSGSRPFQLAAVSSELDPSIQADIVRAVGGRANPPKLLFLLDDLDSSTILFKGINRHPVYRLTEDMDKFVSLVVDQVGLPA